MEKTDVRFRPFVSNAEVTMPNNGPLAVIVENIPAFLKEFLLWCTWVSSIIDSEGRVNQGKFPVSALRGTLIGVNRPWQWFDFKEAVAAYQRGVGVGLGVLLRAEDNIVGIDLDDAIGDDGKIKIWAWQLVQGLPTYWELSPSGRGLRAFVRGTLPPDCPRKQSIADGRIEVYCEGRFLTVTGHRLPFSTEHVQDCPTQLLWLTNRLTARPDLPEQSGTPGTTDLPPADAGRVVEGCAWLRHCRDDAATLSEPEWYAMLSVLGRCQNGVRLAHEWSAPYPNYRPSDTAAKLDQAMARSGPATCEHVESGLGQGRFCQVCPNRGRLRSPIVIGIVGAQAEQWPEPEKLENELLPVAKFDPALLPIAFRPYCIDISERMQVPLDFLGAAIIVSFGSVVGRRARVRVKRHDDWYEVGNLWGGVVADPGSLKTHAIKRIVKVLNRLEDDAFQQFSEAKAQYERDKEAYKERKDAWKQQQRQAHTINGDEVQEFGENPPVEPTCVRFILNDGTVAKVQLISSENPAGLLLFRDEWAGFFAMLDLKGRETDRSFYLESWNGDQTHNVDRIERGTIRAKICLSLFGGIQPAPLRRYLLAAILGGAGDDGLAQRLQVLVYPDMPEEFVNIDREPDHEAEESVTNVFRTVAIRLPDEFAARFDDDAQEYFNQWRETLERRLRNEQMPPYLKAHLAKYRGLMPRIAMLAHLADSGFVAEIPALQVRRAAAWCKYLETHAR